MIRMDGLWELVDSQQRVDGILMVALEPVWQEIARERLRARDLRDAGEFPYVPDDPDYPDEHALAILVEEVGEVAQALLQGRIEDVRAELLQVAAVATSWVVGLDADREEADDG